jgi:DNA repair protein RadC
MKVKSETEAVYIAVSSSSVSAKQEDEVVAHALEILERRIRKCEFKISSLDDVKKFFVLKLAELEHEVFCVLYLNSQNQIICHEELFRGTLNQAVIYPREVVKRALHHNANAIILCHNHPSGLCEASSSDRTITDVIKKALALIEVNLLDHVIVGQTNTLSFVERGYL